MACLALPVSHAYNTAALYVEDGEFEVTAEMLIHEDADDELTLVEAEALESEGEVEEEMADLQQVIIHI